MRKALKKTRLWIHKDMKMYCLECKEVRNVALVDRSQDIDACLLDCGHSRSAYLPPTGVSLEHVSEPECGRLFPGCERDKYQFQRREVY
jgi:hypothetical protein